MIRIGAIIEGKYEVTGFLGGGGMGIVVEARHLTLDTLVAIKFMRSDMIATSGGVERFLREARALVKLKSQHAVKVHDLGIHARMPFIVMEHLEGTDLETLLGQKGRLDVADVARHMRQACEAIAEAHSMGIYHRDLKPANIFLSRGASGRTIVKVLDFGIAKMMQTPSSVAHVSLTGAWTMMGTPHYMSPEQLLSAKDIDGRADIWSLGVVLYQLVTGKLPFDDENQMLLQRRIRFEAPRANPLPPALAPIIYRCLEKKREDRYQTIVDLALALRSLMYESLSPFGSLLAHKDTIRALPDKQRHELAIAEGLISSGAATEPMTIRMPRLPRPIKRAQTRCADSELACAPTARALDEEVSSPLSALPDKPEVQAANSSDVLRPEKKQSGDEPEDQVLFFEAGRRELAIAKGNTSACVLPESSAEAEPTTVRRLSQPMGLGGTLMMESAASNAPVVWQDVRRLAGDDTQTLISRGCEVFPSILRQPNAVSLRRPAMVIGIMMVVAAFVAFVVVLRWSA
jgi:serine/threonine protein kinase